MPARQVARIPLGAGMDAKSDSKHIDVPKMELVQNVELRATGKIRKRRAMLAAPSETTPAVLVGGGRRIALNVSSDYGFNAVASGSLRTSPIYSAPTTRSRTVLANKRAEYHASACATRDGNIYHSAALYDATANKPYFPTLSEIDPETGESLSDEYIFPNTSLGIRCANIRTIAMPLHGILVVWADSVANPATIYGHMFSGSRWRGSPVTLSTAADGTYAAFDVCTDTTGARLYLSERLNGSAGVKTTGWTTGAAGTTLSLTLIDSVTETPAGAGRFGVANTYDTDNDRVAVIVSSEGHETASPIVDVYVYPQDMSGTSTVELSDEAVAGTGVGIAYAGSSQVVCYYHEADTNAAGDIEVVMQATVHTGTLAKGANVRSMHGCVLAHAPVVFDPPGSAGTTPEVFVGVLRTGDPLEPLYVTCMAKPLRAGNYPAPVAAYQYGTALDTQAEIRNSLSSVAVIDLGTGPRAYWGAPIRNEVRVDGGGTIAANLSGGLHSFGYEAERTYNHAHGHDAMMLACGVPIAIVGAHALGAFLHSPRIVSVAGAYDGSMTASTTHSVKAFYEVMDASGRIWRSRVSTSSSVTLGGGDSAVDVEISTPIVAFQNKVANVVQVGVYMTTDGGTSVYYRANPQVGVDVFDWSANSTYTITVTPTDAELEASEVLYTDTRELDHYPAPPMSTVVKHGNRFAGVHSETGDVWFSLEFIEGDGIAWSDVIVVKNDDPRDKPTALVSDSSGLLVLYRNRAGYIYGDGPSNQGLGQPFTNVRFLPDADVGAISQKTVVKLPMGVMFCDDDKGFHVLPYGGGAPQYIGRDVDGAPTQAIVGTAHLPARNEVRVAFYNAESIAGASANWFTFHYDAGQWTIGVAADFSGDVMHATADGDTFILGGSPEVATNGYDAFGQTYVEMRVRTGWIALSGPGRKQGMFRLWQLFLLAQSIDDHNTVVRLWFDYNDTVADTPATDDLSTRLKVWPSKQLVEAFKVEIYDEEIAGTTTGEGFELSDLEIHFGSYGNRPRVEPGDNMAGG